VEHTLIVAPNYIKDLCGVAVIRIGVRFLWAQDEQLKTLFHCRIRKGDDLTQDFMGLVKLIVTRAGESK